jgi:UPF0176 protein
MFKVATFYRFVQIDDLDPLRESLLQRGRDRDIYGTILLAAEGINATIAGEAEVLQHFLSELQEDRRFADLFIRYSWSSERPFRRYKVKRKKEIVTLGVDSIDPVSGVGTYVTPEEWNDLIQQEDVIVIDTRNDYEVGIGTFRGAVNPATPTFRDFPAYVERELHPHKHQKVAMFCTGGIRCEKATAYLRERGFSDVYHLRGGILSYLAAVDPSESLWEGDCFVFDDRIALDENLQGGDYLLCERCQDPVPVPDEAGTTLCAACRQDAE